MVSKQKSKMEKARKVYGTWKPHISLWPIKRLQSSPRYSTCSWRFTSICLRSRKMAPTRPSPKPFVSLRNCTNSLWSPWSSSQCCRTFTSCDVHARNVQTVQQTRDGTISKEPSQHYGNPRISQNKYRKFEIQSEATQYVAFTRRWKQDCLV